MYKHQLLSTFVETVEGYRHELIKYLTAENV